MAMRIALAWIVCAALSDAARAQNALRIRPEVRQACEAGFAIRSVGELIEIWGKPREHEIRSERDPHTGQYRVDLHHATFDEAEAWFAIAEATGADIVWQRLIAHEPGRRISPQAWIGKALSEVGEQWGAPDRVADGRVSYACDENDEVVLVLEEGRISAVEWLGYFD